MYAIIAHNRNLISLKLISKNQRVVDNRQQSYKKIALLMLDKKEAFVCIKKLIVAKQLAPFLAFLGYDSKFFK